MGLTNAAANIMSIVAPLLVGFVVKNESDPAEWRLVFFISAGIYFFGNLMFVLFSKTEIQIWNDPEHRDRRELLFFLWNQIYIETMCHAENFKKLQQFCVICLMFKRHSENKTLQSDLNSRQMKS